MVHFGIPRDGAFPRRVDRDDLFFRFGLEGDASLEFVDVRSLRPHEMILADRLAELRAQIWEDGRLLRPILVEARTGTVLDGHHRLAALRSMGARVVPAVLIPYESENLKLHPRRYEVPVSREEVLRRSAAGLLFPPKTTRHVLSFDPPDVRVRISDLLGSEVSRGEVEE